LALIRSSASVLAGLVGLVITMIGVLIYYRLVGIIANLACSSTSCC
jgi:preprotein translocase subunit SecD